VIYIGGSLLAAYELVHLVPVVGRDRARGRGGNKFQFVSFRFDMTVPVYFLGGPGSAAHPTMASHGTDQLLVQRLLTCKNSATARRQLS